MGNGATRRRQCSRPSSTLHPFVERLIGRVRREYIDRTLFWTTADLETKLFDSNVTIIAIEPMPDWKEACQNRVLRDLHHQ